ncbi:MAG TPA: CHAD domain-containing protein [Burkholderiaceae bacterium]|nr:CHAD domain-containing protein [Burkholderiaceae bacterium]
MGRELELKLGIAAPDLPLLRRRLARLGAARIDELHAIYFDTLDGLLARAGLGLRLRCESGRWVQCLKTAGEGALSLRGEWEAPARMRAGQPQFDRPAFAATPLADLLAAHPRARLLPWLEVRVRRESRELDWDGARIELALDLGTLAAGGREAEVRELELEARSGPAHSLVALAMQLAAPGGRARPLALLPLAESKAQRGARLRHAQPPAPVPASAAAVRGELGPRVAADAALRGVVGRATQILVANLQATLGGDDPETVHQARVAVRRLRAAVRLLDRKAHFPPSLAEELRWLGAQLGRVRDAEVLAERCARAWSRPPRSAGAADVEAWSAHLAARARDARRRLRGQIAGARTAGLLLALLAWSEAPPQGQARLQRLAARRLDSLLKRIARAASDWAGASAVQRHRVRILVKRLRYGVDLALPAPGAAHWRAALRGLQEELGELNDAAVARASLRRLRVPGSLIERVASAPEERVRIDSAGRDLAQWLALRPPWR